MLLYLISDIHLELHKLPHMSNSLILNSIQQKEINPTSSDRILILAGDIGNPDSKLYKKFVTEMAKIYDQVIIIAGNHEYYQKSKKRFDRESKKLTAPYRLTMDMVDREIRNFTSTLPNVHFLQMDTFIYKRVRFLGCTLWTKSEPNLSHLMNDYNQIPNMTPAKCKLLHQTQTTWLIHQLNSTSEDYDTTVVITHHLPTYQLLASTRQDDPTNIFYANHLDALVAEADIWFCGHSHVANSATIGKCRCYLNPYGYVGETTGFSKNFVIDCVPQLD